MDTIPNPTSDSTPHVITVALEVLLALVFLTGGLFNTVLVAVFLRRRGFRSHLSNRFLMNLVLANLLAAFVLIPLVFLDLTRVYSWPASMRGMTTLTSSASILGQLLIGIDQYLAVVNPLHYHRHINEARCRLMCATVWFISLTLAILCALDLSPHDQWIIQWIYLSLAFIIPIVFSFIIYCRIFVAARSNSIRTRRNSSCSMTQEGVVTHQLYSHHPKSKYLNVNNNHLSRSPSLKSNGSNLLHLTSHLRASMRSKLSHASHLLLYGEEGRAAKVTLLVLLSIGFCWLPTCVLACYEGFISNSLPAWTHSVALLCSLCNIVFSPILYGFRSKRVRRDVKKVLGCLQRPHMNSRFDGHRHPQAIQVRRLKSLSCPQLLISSVNDQDSSSLSKTFLSDMKERHAFFSKPQSSLVELATSR